MSSYVRQWLMRCWYIGGTNVHRSALNSIHTDCEVVLIAE